MRFRRPRHVRPGAAPASFVPVPAKAGSCPLSLPDMTSSVDTTDPDESGGSARRPSDGPDADVGAAHPGDVRHRGPDTPVRGADQATPAGERASSIDASDVPVADQAGPVARELSTSRPLTAGSESLSDEPASDEPARAHASARELAMAVCPYLSSTGGAWRMAVPSRDHRCLGLQPPVPQPPEKQQRHCLSSAHVECGIYRAARDVRTVTLAGGADPARIILADASRRPLPRTAPILLEPPRLLDQATRLRLDRAPGQLALAALMVVAFGVVGLSRLSGTPAAEPSSAPSLIAVVPSAVACGAVVDAGPAVGICVARAVRIGRPVVGTVVPDDLHRKEGRHARRPRVAVQDDRSPRFVGSTTSRRQRSTSDRS